MDTNILIIAISSLAGLIVASLVALQGWRGWLALKTAELQRPNAQDAPNNSINARIDIADLKERLRKLEAIAAGVDL